MHGEWDTGKVPVLWDPSVTCSPVRHQAWATIRQQEKGAAQSPSPTLCPQIRVTRLGLSMTGWSSSTRRLTEKQSKTKHKIETMNLEEIINENEGSRNKLKNKLNSVSLDKQMLHSRNTARMNTYIHRE